MGRAAAAALVLVGLIAGVALAGCDLGGTDEPLTEEEYAAEAEGVADEFIASANRIAKEISNVEADLGSAGDLIGTFAEEADALAARIDEITPPEAVAHLHARLIEILEGFAAKAENASIALKAGDLLGGIPALAGFAAEALEVGDRLDAVVARIRERLGLAPQLAPGLGEPTPQAP